MAGFDDYYRGGAALATDCIFCEILAGRAEASFVYRDDRLAAFMTLGAINPGHVLVVPVAHAAGLGELEPALGGDLFQLGMGVADAIRVSDRLYMYHWESGGLSHP